MVHFVHFFLPIVEVDVDVGLVTEGGDHGFGPWAEGGSGFDGVGAEKCGELAGGVVFYFNAFDLAEFVEDEADVYFADRK